MKRADTREKTRKRKRRAARGSFEDMIKHGTNGLEEMAKFASDMASNLALEEINMRTLYGPRE